MDPKKLESRLCEWSRELGFTLPDGTFAQSNLFSLLISTPHTVHLWEEILKKVEARDKLQKIKKQILVATVKSDEKQENAQGPILNFHNSGIQRKIELWKKKKALVKMITEKRNEVDHLRDDIYKKAQLIQLESCKLAEIEKYHSDLKEKLLISNLVIDKHKNEVKIYEEQIAKVKSYQLENTFDSANILKRNIVLESIKERLEKMIMENSEKLPPEMREGNGLEITELITDKNLVSKLRNLLMAIKMNNLKECSAVIDESHLKESDRNSENQDAISLKLMKEKFMLDITENSLLAISNRKLEKLEGLKLKEITSNIEKLMFNKSIASSSQFDISYLQSNETGDSLTGRREKMTKFMKALSVYGLKKRKEFLNHEIEKLIKENKKNEHWSSEKEEFENEVLCSSMKLESARKEVSELMSVEKSSALSVIKSHNELILVTNNLHNDLRERKVIEMMSGFLMDLKNGSKKEIELVSEMCVDAFRRIHTCPEKEMYEFESLQHCMDHYGGELREFFSKLLISPYEKPEIITSKLEERKLFTSYIVDLLSKFEEETRNVQNRLAGESSSAVNPDTIEKNHKETLRILSRVSARQEKLKSELDLVRNILKCWLKQPYRLMIPECILVKSMTLRHFEEKYKTVQSEVNYCTELNQSVAYK